MTDFNTNGQGSMEEGGGEEQGDQPNLRGCLRRASSPPMDSNPFYQELIDFNTKDQGSMEEADDEVDARVGSADTW